MLKKRSLFIIILVLTTLAGGLFLLKKQKDLHRIIESKLIELVNQDVFKATGIVIEELKINWKDLHLVLRLDNIRATLNGPLRYAIIGWGKRHYLKYTPKLTLEKISLWKKAGLISTPIDLSLQLTLSKNFNEVLKFVGNVDAAKFVWPAFGINIEKPFMATSYVPLKKHFSVELKSKSLSYESPDKKIMLGLQNPQIKATSELNEIYNFIFECANAEILNGNDYFDIPLSDIKLSGAASTKLSNLDLLMQSQKEDWATHLKIDKTHFDWQIELSNLKLFLPWIAKTFNLPPLKDFTFESGSLQAKLAGPVLTPFSLEKLIKTASGFFELKNFSFSPTNNLFKVNELNLHLPFSPHKKTQGELSLNNLTYRQVNAKIKPTPLLISSLAHVDIREPLIIENSASPLTLETLEVDFFTAAPYSLKTKAVLKPTPLKDVFNALCIQQNMPASQLDLNFSEVELTENNLKTEGDVTLKFLGGEAKLNEVKVYRLFSCVPETQFDLNWQGMKLQDINNFVRFGKMEGDFEGYFKNVVFQGGLPTQFNFLFKVNPGKKGQVVFLSRAMKNFIQLFTPEDFQKYMIGPLNWFAFGWASDLIGGYNIDYAGLSLYSHQGSILLETLDPESVVKNTKKHFILSGPRVKVPVQSHRYPVVLDAYGITNFMTHIRSQVDAINSEESNEVGIKNTIKQEILNATDPCLNFKKNE